MFANVSSHEDRAIVKVTPAQHRTSPGVRIDFGPLYLSLSVAEGVDLVDALTGALARLAGEEILPQFPPESPPGVRRDEVSVRVAAEAREDLGLTDDGGEVGAE